MCPLVTLRDYEKHGPSLLCCAARWPGLSRTGRTAHRDEIRLDTHQPGPAEADRQAEAMPVPREAVGVYRQLLALNHSAYLLEHVQRVAFPGNVLVKNSRFGEAVAPLIN
jgi:hypothetical protein